MMSSDSHACLVMQDFSRGQEAHAIPYINTCDDEGPPSNFTYNLQVNKHLPTVCTAACDCSIEKGGCMAASCSCSEGSAKGSGDGRSGGGPLTDCASLEPDVGYTSGQVPGYTQDPCVLKECGPACPCATSASSCHLRATQGGLNVKVCLVKSSAKGWAVEARQAIPSGTFVCEYLGQYVTSQEAQRRLALYDGFARGGYACNTASSVPNIHPLETAADNHVQAAAAGDIEEDSNPAAGRAVQAGDPLAGDGAQKRRRLGEAEGHSAQQQWQQQQRRRQQQQQWQGHALLVLRQVLPSGLVLRANIDATMEGNLARFFNHSCDGGNMQLALAHRNGCLLPAVVLFASRNIAYGEEMTFAYGPPNPGPNIPLEAEAVDLADPAMDHSGSGYGYGSGAPDGGGETASGACVEQGLAVLTTAVGGPASQPAFAATAALHAESTADAAAGKSGVTSGSTASQTPDGDASGVATKAFALAHTLVRRCRCGTAACQGWMPAEDV